MEDFKKDVNSNTLIIGDYNTPLSTTDRSSKPRSNKDVVVLKDTLDQMDLTDIYRTFFFFFLIFIVIQLQLYAFSPHPSTPTVRDKYHMISPLTGT